MHPISVLELTQKNEVDGCVIDYFTYFPLLHESHVKSLTREPWTLTYSPFPHFFIAVQVALFALCENSSSPSQSWHTLSDVLVWSTTTCCPDVHSVSDAHCLFVDGVAACVSY